jgi:hypothetical protein
MPMVEGKDSNSKGDSSSNSDSNEHSELLVLASSQFDSMDGIEYSGISSIEISSSIELDSNSDDDSTSALGIAFSPRKTRSGKVVSYYSKE